MRIYQNDTLFSLQKNRWSGKNGNCGLQFNVDTGDYVATPKSKQWVEQMEEMAQMEVDADDAFDE